MEGSLEQDLDSLFEGALAQSTSIVDSVDTVTSDTHELASRRHDVDQRSQMSMVHTITTEDHVELLEKTGACRFNTEGVQDLLNVIRHDLAILNVLYSHDLFESHTISFNDPIVLTVLLFAIFIVVDDATCGCLVRVTDLGDLVDTLECKLVQQQVFDFLEEDGHGALVVLKVWGPDSEHMLLDHLRVERAHNVNRSVNHG